jgi:UDP-3-O-acyl-N-acetylglucosamine deacetylase
MWIIELNASELPIMDGSSSILLKRSKAGANAKTKGVKSISLLTKNRGSEILIMP